jgi:tetratricopeptide (TPR) repeat protein
MPGTENTPVWHQYRDAMTKSVKLMRDDKHQEALGVVEEAVAEAIRRGESSWVLTLSHHAAVISSFIGDTQLVKRYYDQSLAFVPENPRALYGLAKIAREQGETEAAREYALRSYQALKKQDDGTVKQGLLELLIAQWPEVEGK